MGDLESTQSRYSHLGVPDPEWTAFYEKNPARVPHLVGSPQHLRQIMAELKIHATAMAPEFTELTTKDIKVKASDGVDLDCRIYTPIGVEAPTAGLVYIHGGGWTLGDLEGEDIACRAICEYVKIVVVAMDYRLAPENPFPRGLEDCWDVFLWTIENSSTLGIDPGCLLLGGSSSGGSSTAVIAHRARDKGIGLKGQILRIPSTCHIACHPPELNLHSMEELKDAPLLSKASMETFYGYYNPPTPASPDVSPLLNENFKDLAPAYLQVAGMDPLRDEGLAYADKLKDAGVPTKVDIYPGLPHAFGYFPELSATARVSADLITAITQLIEGKI